MQCCSNLSGNVTTEDYSQKSNVVSGAGRKKVAAYLVEIRAYPMEKIAYVDECGIDAYLHWEYGHTARGQRVFSRINGRKYKRCGIVAAQMNGRILAPLHYDGTMDSSLFEFWFANQFFRPWRKAVLL